MIKILNRLFKRREIKKAESEAPKNGKWKEFNKHATLISEGHYVDGIRNGLWKFYYDSGELLIEEEYNLGKKNGKYNSFFRNGKLMSHGRFSNDLREGEFKVYSEQGRLTKVLVFKNDELIEEINPTLSPVAAQRLTYDLPMLVVFIAYILYWGAQLI
ncbi:MAG: hypothetical protein ABJH04_09485 [Cyclobacteriaceae bacterium]